MDLLNPGPQQQNQRQLLTEQQIAQMHDTAEALQKNALDSSPIYSPWAGAARMADALVGNITQSRQADAQRDITGYTEQQLAKTLGIPIPGQPSQALPSAPEAQSAPGAVSQNEKDAIAANESGGNYGEIGPHVPATHTHPAGYALGKYQVMNYDLPNRLAAAGLPPMNEAEFLRNPKAQEAQFDHEFGNLRQSHSFADAASMWHSGVPLNQAIKEHRTDARPGTPGMTTESYVQKALRYLNPVSPAGAAEAPAGPSPSQMVAGAFGGPRNPDNPGQPQYLGNPGGPQVPTPMPRPAGMSAGAPVPAQTPTPPQPAAAPAPPTPPAPAAPARPTVGPVTPLPAGTGQPIPGTMSLQQQHAILNLIGQPATHELGLSLAKKYLMPEETNAPTGFKYMGTPGAGYTPSQMPAVPTPVPTFGGPMGITPQGFLPGARTPELNVPTVGGAGATGMTTPGNNPVGDLAASLHNLGEEHGKKIFGEQGYAALKELIQRSLSTIPGAPQAGATASQ